MINLHVHTWRCGHARGTAVEMAEAAQREGISVLGFAEHAPLPVEIDDWHVSLIEFPAYVAEVEEARSQYPDVEILLGIEADFIPEYVDFVRDFCAQDVFDYVIGSVHYIGGWNFDYEGVVDEWDSRDPADVYARYYELVREAARTGIFDVIGHLDLPKKFGHRMPEKVWPEVVATLRVIKEEGLALELNTAGLFSAAEEMYPSDSILAAAAELGVPITLGTDAHGPERIASGLGQATTTLSRLGFDRAVYFRKRKMRFVPLEALVRK